MTEQHVQQARRRVRRLREFYVHAAVGNAWEERKTRELIEREKRATR